MSHHGVGLKQPGELIRQAELVTALKPEDFRKNAFEDVQKLIRDLIIRQAELDSALESHSRELEKLKESSRQYEDLFNFAPLGYFNLDTGGVITGVNFTASDMLNIPRGELLNSRFAARIEPRHQETFRSHLSTVMETGSRLSCEVEMRRSDNSTFYAQLYTVVLPYPAGKILRVSVMDITERKRAETALKESEERFRSTLDNMLEACVIVDFNWRYVYANDASTRLGHRTREQRLGRTMMEVYPGIENQETFAHLRRSMETRLPALYETEFTFPEGDTGLFEVRAEPVPQGMLILYEDITERKRAETALKESEQRYRDLADLSPEIIFETDIRGTVTYANAKALASLDLGKEYLSKGHNIMEFVLPEQRSVALERFARIMQGEDIGANEYTLLRKDGGTFPALVHTARIVRQGKVLGVRGVVVDISERKAAEQHLKKGIERLEYIYGVAKIAVMQPVGLLMMEHRLIERVVTLLAWARDRMEQSNTLDRELIEYVAEFFRIYADKTHHGKEENILFKALAAKSLLPEHQKTMDELVEEHNMGRKLVADLVAARDRWASGDADALKQLITAADGLVKLYPQHIEKEDKHFFPSSMEYLSAQEQNEMLLEFWEFDRQLIHVRYTQGLEALTKP